MKVRASTDSTPSAPRSSPTFTILSTYVRTAERDIRFHEEYTRNTMLVPCTVGSWAVWRYCCLSVSSVAEESSAQFEFRPEWGRKSVHFFGKRSQHIKHGTSPHKSTLCCQLLHLSCLSAGRPSWVFVQWATRTEAAGKSQPFLKNNHTWSWYNNDLRCNGQGHHATCTVDKPPPPWAVSLGCCLISRVAAWGARADSQPRYIPRHTKHQLLTAVEHALALP